MTDRGKWSPDGVYIRSEIQYCSTFFCVLEISPSLSLFFFLRQGLRLGTAQSCCVAQTGLKLRVLLPQAPVCWNYRHMPPRLCRPCTCNKATLSSQVSFACVWWADGFGWLVLFAVEVMHGGQELTLTLNASLLKWTEAQWSCHL